MNKLYFVLMFLVISYTVVSQKLHSVSGSMPAYPYPQIYTQPNGSKLSISAKGDEYLHWAKTTDGFTLIKNSQNGLDYATLNEEGNLVPSGIMANEINNRTNEEQIFLKSTSKNLMFSKKQINKAISKRKKPTKSSNAFPSTGTSKFLTILVNFSNTNTTYTQSNFNDYMNQIGYNFQNATGSFKDYYLATSLNQLTINTTVTSWVTLSNPHDYYGGAVINWIQLANDAIVAVHNANPLLDFSQFDNDGDGIVDGISIIHQGKGQEETLDTNDVWSHSTDLSYYGYNLFYNGVSIGPYTIEPELLLSGMTSIGVMCHEFGHNLGLPDLYATDYSSEAMGKWEIMDAGSWNNGGKTPPIHNTWSKSVLYWITPTTISNTTPTTYTLNDALQSTDCYIIYTPNSTDEFFMLENRQNSSWDTYLPGHGMLVLHVDQAWIYNYYIINDDPTHQAIDIEEADNTYTTINKGDGGDAFPGISNNNAFTDATSPNMRSWAGVNTGMSITNITENTSTNVITFCVNGCSSGNLTSDFYASNTSVVAGNTITFTSSPIIPSGTTITNYQWTFTGGNPSSYVGQNPPPITYNNVGSYNVSLTVTNSAGSNNTSTKNNFISVNPIPTSNWIVQTGNFNDNRGVKYISIVNPNNIWAIGCSAMSLKALNEYTVTSNGGATWASGIMTGIPQNNIPSSISALSLTTAYITAYDTTNTTLGGVFVTNNGGLNWTKQATAFTGSGSYPNIVHFFNSNEGFCMGNPNGGYFEIYTTINGGTNWIRVPQSNISPNLSNEKGYENMFDAIGDTVWFATNKGRVYKSTDKGLHWFANTVNGFTDFNDLTFNDANNGIAVQINNNVVAIDVTNDGGSTWNVITPGSGMFFSDIDGIPGVPGKYISVGTGSSYTTDYGVTWNNIDYNTLYLSTKFYNSITGWAGGLNYYSYVSGSFNDGIYKYNALISDINEIIKYNNDELLIYPNPAKNKFTVSIPQHTSYIEISNSLGQLIEKRTVKNESELSFEIKQNGMYFIKVVTEKEIITKKVVINK